MSNIVLHGAPAETEGIFFGLTPQVTDWDAFLAAVPTTGLDGLLAECHSLEPLEETDPNDYKMWILQQKIRAVLRFKEGMEIVGKETCTTCGTRKVDPVHKHCLYCEEREYQVGRLGNSRGSMQFLTPTYDPTTRAWGLLYYRSFDRNSTYMFWLAMGFKTRENAEAALAPFHYYGLWLERKYHSLRHEWDMAQRLFGISEMMDRKDLPFNPSEFEQESRERIRTDMSGEHGLSTWHVAEAIRELNRNESE